MSKKNLANAVKLNRYQLKWHRVGGECLDMF